MPEFLRALVVILFLSSTVWVLARKPLTAALIDDRDYKRRVSLWVMLTLAAFLAHSFWLFILVACVLLLLSAKADSNPVAMYAMVVFAIPSIRVSIEGFAGINRFIDIDYPRVLALVVLLPAALRAAADPERARLFKMPSDKYLLGYLALQIAIIAPYTSLTDIMRTALTYLLDAWLPYYVFSRCLGSQNRMRDMFASFVAGCCAMALIAWFETLKGWLLYSTLQTLLKVQWAYGSYMFRDSTLRAVASAGHSIYLGYLMSIALALQISLKDRYGPYRRAWLAGLILLGGAVAMTLSRGAWFGAATIVLVSAALEPQAKRVWGRAAILAVVLVPLLAATPLGSTVQSYLPFVGRYDEGSVDYRQQLFTVSWGVFLMNPILGSPFYLATPAMEVMRQGQGIIDMVNTYLGIALGTGLIGLGLFLGVFLSSAARLLRAARSDEAGDEGEGRLTRGLLAALAGIAVTIATVGSDGPVALVYWCIAGACAAQVHRLAHAQSTLSATFLRRAYVPRAER